MTTTLDTSLRELFNDRRLLDRTVRCIALDQGLTYLGALEQLHDGVASAYQHGKPTLRSALARFGADLPYIEESLQLLERRDAAVDAAFQRAAGQVLLDEQVDEHGRVLLDQDAARPLPGAQAPSGRRAEQLTTDIGAALADPQEFERRLARMRVADRSGYYDTDAGREKFRSDDRANLESGLDLVATAERGRQLAGAQRSAEHVAAQLDAAIAKAADKRAKLKLLDAEMDKLEASAPAGVSFDDARDQLHSHAAAAGRDEPLKLLDQLEQPGTSAAIEDPRELAAELERRRQVEDPGQFLKTLEAAVAGDPLPDHAPRSPADDPSDDEELLRAGIHPGSHRLDQVVREKMRELDLPESEYPRILEQMLQEVDEAYQRASASGPRR